MATPQDKQAQSNHTPFDVKNPKHLALAGICLTATLMILWPITNAWINPRPLTACEEVNMAQEAYGWPTMLDCSKQ